MSLTPGSRLGPYEIAGPLGAGGTGQVFRARDPRRRLLMMPLIATESSATQVHLVLNFLAELRQRVR